MDGLQLLTLNLPYSAPEDYSERMTGARAAIAGLAKLADLAADVAAAASWTDRSPTENQIEAGNYRKGKISLHGLNISIENAKGSWRSGTNSSGRKWRTKLTAHYGYFLGTQGKDGDHVDVFIGPNPECELIFIVNQIDPDTGRFDEHKAVIGTASEQEATKLYLSNYQDGWKGLGSITAMTLPQFKKWIWASDHTKRAEETHGSSGRRDDAEPGAGDQSGRTAGEGGAGLDTGRAAGDSDGTNSKRADTDGSWNLLNIGDHAGEDRAAGKCAAARRHEDISDEQAAELKAIGHGSWTHEACGHKGGCRCEHRGDPRMHRVLPGLCHNCKEDLVAKAERVATSDEEAAKLKADGHGIQFYEGCGHEEGCKCRHRTDPRLREVFPGKCYNCKEKLADKQATFDATWAKVGEVFEKVAADGKTVTIAVDLDGTLAEPQETFNPDKIEKPRRGAKRWMQMFRDAGARLIIFTVRGDKQQVQDWLDEHEIAADHINENPDQPEGTSGKVIADIYLDDRAVDASGAWAGFGPGVLETVEAA